MKRVRINEGKIGLVFKNGYYLKVITDGVYWLGINQRVLMYNQATSFGVPIALELLVRDEKLTALIDVVEVKDNELVLVNENGIFKTVLKSGRYTYWKGLIDRTYTRVDLSKIYKIFNSIKKWIKEECLTKLSVPHIFHHLIL